MPKPVSLILGRMDPAASLAQAEWVRDHIPVMQAANGSGKFYRNYISYGFWRDSALPLVRDFVDLLEAQRAAFESVYQRPMKIDFIYLSYVADASQEVCLWHKDGYWWNGQFHLTILGNAQIAVRANGAESLIHADNGRAWYLNGSEYQHKIATGHAGPRFELLAPCDFREESLRNHRLAVTATPERWLDPAHPALREEQDKAINYMKKSIAEGRASNLNVADWPV